jgi:hypothetical protein
MSYKSKRERRKNQQARNSVPKGGELVCAVYLPGTEAAIQAGMRECGVDRKRFTTDLCEFFRVTGGAGMVCRGYADPQAPHMVLMLVSYGPAVIAFAMLDINDVGDGETLAKEAA